MKKHLLLLSIFLCSIVIQAQNVMSFTTTRAVGKTVKITLNAEVADQVNVWVDLNNNATKDVGETVTGFGPAHETMYTLKSQSFSIYGDVTFIDCSNNDFSSIDVTSNPALKTLYCYMNELHTIDLSQNTLLFFLNCSDCELSALDLTHNYELTYLSCQMNPFTTIDLSKNPFLKRINCFFGHLTSLDVSHNLALEELECYGNAITSLDLSKNTSLSGVQCYTNQLTELNLANGFNSRIASLEVTNNPNLTCIQVDAGFTPSNSWMKDDIATWSQVPCDGGNAVELLKTSNLKVWSSANTLSISNLIIGQKYLITDISGRLLVQDNAQSSLITLELNQGFYIVNSGNQTFKVFISE